MPFTSDYYRDLNKLNLAMVLVFGFKLDKIPSNDLATTKVVAHYKCHRKWPEIVQIYQGSVKIPYAFSVHENVSQMIV